MRVNFFLNKKKGNFKQNPGKLIMKNVKNSVKNTPKKKSPKKNRISSIKKNSKKITKNKTTPKKNLQSKT